MVVESLSHLAYLWNPVWPQTQDSSMAIPLPSTQHAVISQRISGYPSYLCPRSRCRKKVPAKQVSLYRHNVVENRSTLGQTSRMKLKHSLKPEMVGFYGLCCAGRRPITYQVLVGAFPCSRLAKTTWWQAWWVSFFRRNKNLREDKIEKSNR